MPITSETRAMVLLAAEICEEKKATDTRILELDPVDAGFTDFFLITSGSNTRQTGAIADDIELRLKREFGVYAKSVEGRRQGEWILLDYIDFVVHIFTEQTREFYDIERLRKSARSVDAAELSAALRHKTEEVRSKAPAKKGTAKAARKAPSAKTIATKKAPAKKRAAASAIPAIPAKTSSAKSAASQEGPARKAPAKKNPAKKAPSKSSAKQAPSKSPAKKVPAKKAPAKKSPL